MKKMAAALVGSLLVVAAPVVALAQTASSTDQSAKIQSLLQLIAVLEQKLLSLKVVQPGLPTEISTCPFLSRPLSRGMSGDDVRSLQQFLAIQGYLAHDSVTGYFGAVTEAAVQSWQAAHGVVSAGTAQSTGFGKVGPATRSAIASACVAPLTVNSGAQPQNTAPPPANPTLPYISSFSVSPASVSYGQSATLTWSAKNAAGCTLYKQTKTQSSTAVLPGLALSGSVVITPSDTAIYTMTCSSPTDGGFPASQSLGVTVLGAPAPVDYAKFVFDASPVQGEAPLAVTFDAPVNTTGACIGGSQLMDFGDGTTKSLSYAGGCNPSKYSLTHTYTINGTYNAVLYSGSDATSVAAGKAVVYIGTSPADALAAAAAPPATLTVKPSAIQTGETASVQWTSKDVSSCTLTSDPHVYGSNQTSGETTLQFLHPNTITFTLNCTGTSGTPVTQTAMLTITQGAQMQI